VIQPTRIQALNDRPVRRGRYILYWMQQSQRAEWNHALEYAIGYANEAGLPLVAYFGCTARFPGANARNLHFMLQGLFETRSRLAARGIQLVIRMETPVEGTLRMAENAALVITDRGYLGVQRAWRAYAGAQLECPLVQVESDVVVPVEEASPKEEYAAATLRPKLRKKLADYLVPLRARRLKKDSLALKFTSWKGSDPLKAVKALGADAAAWPVTSYPGGAGKARKMLESFAGERLDRYNDDRSDPSLDCVSRLSPYLHFGHISPLFMAIMAAKRNSPGSDAFIEELVVRRELAVNFIYYNRRYDDFSCVPDWAKESLKKHEKDRRYSVYSREELENARTHDPYWNAAQREMLVSGHMHGYMRMYWGKKILEWSAHPADAYATALALNNTWELDGRDANGFAGVAWCFGKHDRPWPERAIFGKVRFMNERGLERKFDIESYEKAWRDKT
jgi:deoxyribodipyrimidine photo-lyase